ncbi:MAG: efflux RND transporter periplasmic adaptor subunit [Candidatus Cryptobacteroides sp.]
MKISKIMAISAAVIAAGSAVSCGSGQPAGQESTAYRTTVIEASEIELSRTYPASICGRQDIAIHAQVAGTISQVCVAEGERVRKGQSLFIIDQVPYKAALQMAEANVQAAQAGVATAELLYESRRKLQEKEVISDYDLQTSWNQLLTAKAQLAQAEAQLVTAKNNMTYTMVLSPADGVVGTIPFREGTLVSPSSQTALTTVSDNSVMYVYFSLTENSLLELTRNHSTMQEALKSLPETTLRLNDGTIYPETGRIETISGVIDRSTGSVQLRAEFRNQGGILHSGGSGNIIMKEKYEDVIVIPCSATFEVQDLRFVFRVVDGKAAATRVETRLSDDGRSYLVTSGLNPGDIIVTEGAGLLKEGQEIKVEEAAL